MSSLERQAGVLMLVRKEYTNNIEEGTVASKSLHENFGYFLSVSHQAVSADITASCCNI
jgi:hypothetical protein